MNIIVLDTNLDAIAILDTFKSLIWADRFREAGDFEAYFAMEQRLLDYLKEDYYLSIANSEHLMIIENLAINSDVEEGNNLVIKGRSVESILDRRIVWGQRSIKGNLQNGIRTLLNENVIFPSISSRAISNFVFEESDDPAITSLKVDAQYTGTDLYDVVKGLCESNNIGFKITLNDNKQFVFKLYAGKDRSYDQTVNPYVVFSPRFDNIINSNYYTSKSNLKTVTYVAGEGEGTARKSAVIGSGSGLTRRELFTDARDISSDTEGGTLTDAEYMAKLRARGIKKLAEHTTATAFEGKADVTHSFKYGEDFTMGDTVQVANEYGHESAAYISEIIISQDNGGISIYPTFKTITEEGETE